MDDDMDDDMDDVVDPGFSKLMFSTHFKIMAQLGAINVNYSQQLPANDFKVMKQLILIDSRIMTLLWDTYNEFIEQEHINFMESFDYWVEVKYRQWNQWLLDNPHVNQANVLPYLENWFKNDLDEPIEWLPERLLEKREMLRSIKTTVSDLMRINVDLPKQLGPMATNQWLDTNVEFRQDLLKTNYEVLQQLFPKFEYFI
jgi:hypothetical protein